jgi:hypothetical protein
VHPERIHPKVVFEFGIARGDVAGNSFAETEFGKNPKRGGKALFAMQTLFGTSLENRRFRRLGELNRSGRNVGSHSSILAELSSWLFIGLIGNL